MNMSAKDVHVLTLHPSRRKGVLMQAEHYRIFREYILQNVQKHREIVFQEMLEDAQELFSTQLEGNVSWCLLMVKLDLEARGIIRTHINNRQERLQVLKLSRQYRLTGNV